jgi:nucleotide-binding universal stress UspA family protein
VRLPFRTHEAGTSRRILFPFIGSTVSQRTVDATLRLARAQDATLVPAYLVVVPHHLSLESAAPVRETEAALPVLELIDQRASRAGVPVDSRIERGRSHRHALSSLVEHERFDTIVVPARTSTSDGFEPADVAWLLEHAPGEVLVLRPEAGSPHPAVAGGLSEG